MNKSFVSWINTLFSRTKNLEAVHAIRQEWDVAEYAQTQETVNAELFSEGHAIGFICSLCGLAIYGSAPKFHTAGGKPACSRCVMPAEKISRQSW